MKKALNNIREFFWPLLEQEPDQKPLQETNEVELVISKENLEEAYKLEWKVMEAEEDRRKGIESKASIFISTISIAASLVLAANVLIANTQVFTFHIRFSIILSFVLSIYAVRTVWFSVKTLQRGRYSVLSLDELNVPGNKDEYHKHLIMVFTNIIEKNKDVINSKVDNFTMAQEYFKRAIVTLSFYSFLVLISSYFPKQSVQKTEPVHIEKVQLFTKPMAESGTLKPDSILRLHNKKPIALDSVRPY